MSLRRQLLMVSLLLLSLPWAGCQFLREIETTLRQGQQQSLEATARAVATAMQDRPHLLYPQSQRLNDAADPRLSLYTSPGPNTVIMDGYADGWNEQDYHRFHSSSDTSPLMLAYQAITRGDRLYLLLRVRDPDLLYSTPGLQTHPNGTRIHLTTGQQGRDQHYLIAPVAPGSVRGQFAGPRERGMDPQRLRGYWQDTPGGYTVELEMPLSFTGDRLGVYAVSVDSATRRMQATAGNIAPTDTSPPPWLVRSPTTLQQALAPFRAQPAQALQVVDIQGWLIGNPGQTGGRGAPAVASADQHANTDTFWLLRSLYRAILRQPPRSPAIQAPWGKLQGAEIDLALGGRVASRWYHEKPESRQSGGTYLSAAAPVTAVGEVIGAVIARASSEEYLSLTDRAFSRLLAVSLLALGAATLGLLGYASLLSWRIRKLSRAAATAVNDRGDLRENFPRSRAADEIGELSRRYADLLDQLRGYHDYLRTLSRKLAHELRTPIAIIQSSLDNLEAASISPGEAATYRDRARQGLVRLNAILNAMSEANQLEESVRNAPLHRFDLVPVLQEVGGAYQSIYPNHHLTMTLEPATAWIHGTPELVVQAMDKLMENAASFSTPPGSISIHLDGEGGYWRLQVANEGPPLPAALNGQLFEPMVSERKSGSGTVHLGLGLHVVQLICTALGGRAKADNLTDKSGAVFTLQLPAVA